MATFTGKRGLHGVVNVGAVPAFAGKRGLHGVANEIAYEGSPLDSLILFPPGASSLPSSAASVIQLGSWLMADPGADYGARGLIRSIESGNALVDGGVFGNRYAPVRRMAFPLIVNSAAPATSPALWEAAIVRAAMPGAMIAIVPEATATRQEVFFDVIDGRWEPDYNTFHNRAGVRKGTLYLDTQPYGYWPTEILLASSASVGWNGQMPVNGASLIGDVAPLAHVTIVPTTPSAYVGGSWFTDMLAWSLAGKPSFNPMIGPAAFVCVATSPLATGYTAASLSGDKFAPASQAWTLLASPAMLYNLVAGTAPDLPWTNILLAPSGIPSALEPAYRGRFRVFAFARMVPSQAPWSMIVDAERYTGYEQALASSNQLATWYSNVASGLANYPNNVLATAVIPSPGYSLYDCGELTLPPQGSGFQQSVALRLWAAPPSGAAIPSALAPPMGATTTQLFFGGLYLLPVDGAAGVVVGGLAQPTIGGAILPQSVFGGVPTFSATAVVQAGVEFNSRGEQGAVAAIVPGASQTFADLRAMHRGVAPRIGASTNALAILTGDRLRGATGPVVNAGFEFVQASVSYRPAFQFLYGL